MKKAVFLMRILIFPLWVGIILVLLIGIFFLLLLNSLLNWKWNWKSEFSRAFNYPYGYPNRREEFDRDWRRRVALLLDQRYNRREVVNWKRDGF